VSEPPVIRASDLRLVPIYAADVTICQRCWAMVLKQRKEAHMYWHEKLDEQIGGDPDA
jgi:hypothetical protein